MLLFVSNVEKRKIKFFFKKILELLHLKLLVYKTLITPSQEIALYRLRRIMDNSVENIFKNVVGKKIKKGF